MFDQQNTLSLYSEHETQRNKILELFRIKGGFCYTMDLIDLHIYQYNARIKELRELGCCIESCKLGGKFAFKLLSEKSDV